MKDRDDVSPSRIMTAIEVAEYLRVHLATVYKLARSGHLPVFKIGSEYRFDRNEIDKWITDLQAKG